MRRVNSGCCAGARVVPRGVALVGASVGALTCDHGVARSRATSCTTLLATRGALRVALIAATPDARAVARSMGPSPAACGPPGRWKMASGCWSAAARAAILAPLAGYRDGETGVDAASLSVAAELRGDAPRGAENCLRGAAPQVACLDVQLMQRGTLLAAAGPHRAAAGARRAAGPAAPHRTPRLAAAPPRARPRSRRRRALRRSPRAHRGR